MMLCPDTDGFLVQGSYFSSIRPEIHLDAKTTEGLANANKVIFYMQELSRFFRPSNNTDEDTRAWAALNDRVFFMKNTTTQLNYRSIQQETIQFYRFRLIDTSSITFGNLGQKF